MHVLVCVLSIDIYTDSNFEIRVVGLFPALTYVVERLHSHIRGHMSCYQYRNGLIAYLPFLPDNVMLREVFPI